MTHLHTARCDRRLRRAVEACPWRAKRHPHRSGRSRQAKLAPQPDAQHERPDRRHDRPGHEDEERDGDDQLDIAVFDSVEHVGMDELTEADAHGPDWDRWPNR